MRHSASCLLILACFAASAQAQQPSFGFSAVIGDNEILIGQPISMADPGTIIVFRPTDEGTSWQPVAELSASDGVPADLFGLSIELSDSLLFVGAPNANGSRGAIYVYERDGTTGDWIEESKLAAAGADSAASLGSVVATSGRKIYAGAAQHAGGSGAVFTFQSDGNGWHETETIYPADPQPTASFGASIAIRDGRLYVGAPGHNDWQGAVHVFDTETGTEMAILEGPDDGHASLGLTVTVLPSGSILAGSPGIIPGVPPTGSLPAGAVYGFEIGEGSTWSHSFTLHPDSSVATGMFGMRIAHAGGFLYVAAPTASQLAGVVQTYTRDDESGDWTLAGTIEPSDGDRLFGMAIDASDDLLVVTTPLANFGQGAAALFVRSSETGMHESVGRLSRTQTVPLTASGPAECSEGVAGQFDCKEVDMLSFLPIDMVGGDGSVRINDIWGWTDPETGQEWALLGRTNGMAFVDVTDPANPVYAGDLPLTDGARPSSWRDIKVHADHAFIVADNAGNHGMQVFDLRQLRDVEGNPVEFVQTAHYDGIASAHNIVINEDTGFAFAVGSSGGGETCGGGLHMINVQDPANPQFAGCFAHEQTGRSGTGYSHDAQCVLYHGPDTEYSGREICFGSNETALSIADITDKANPLALSQATYPNVVYAHQGWLTDDHTHFYMNDELDELQGKIVGTRTLIWDVTDLDDPQLLKEVLSENKSSDHNLYIHGNLMYQSNYKSGLRILDISDLENPVEVGYFDTVPDGLDEPGFGGSWSNYPYFESGTIIVSSMDEGLFVLKKRDIDI